MPFYCQHNIFHTQNIFIFSAVSENIELNAGLIEASSYSGL